MQGMTSVLTGESVDMGNLPDELLSAKCFIEKSTRANSAQVEDNEKSINMRFIQKP